LCVFFLLQVTDFLTAGKKGRMDEAVTDPLSCLDFLAAAREPMRRQWLWRVEKTRRHYSSSVPEVSL
jgi:hypothetical protein